MPSGAEFLSDNPKTSVLIAGNFGEGGTSFMITFPKFYYIGFRQGGLEVIRQEKNRKHQGNLVRYEELIPKTDEELKEMYRTGGTFSQKLKEACELAQKGEIETLLLDDFTDGVENEQKYIWTHQTLKTEKGAIDTQSMYGALKLKLSNRFDREILPFRKHGNLVVRCHLMRESEQVVDGNSTRAGAVDKNSDIYPDIIGSFRREVQRKFENVIYLESKLDAEGKKKYVAYTSKQVAFGTVILAKNALGLPDKVENVTYESLFKNLTTTKQAVTPTK